MQTAVTISPVNMEERRTLGVRAGDTVRVHQKIQEKGKTRIQVFEGLVLARKHNTEPGATFTVRKVVDGIGVEKVFPLYSPLIDKIEVVRRSKVRRAKLYHIREKVAREVKRMMRKLQMVNISTESEMEQAARAEREAEETAKRAEEEAARAAEEAKKAEEATQAASPADEPSTESATSENPDTAAAPADEESEKKA